MTRRGGGLITPAPMALDESQLQSVIESLLLMSPDPVATARIVEIIRIEDPQIEDEDVQTAIENLVQAYEDDKRATGRGFRVEQVSGGLQFRTVPENGAYVRRFLAAKPQRLSKAALETLAVIAYRQPATKPEIEAIRGVDVGAAIKGLLDRDLIRILGKREEVGRPIIYGTTPYFLEFFGLVGLDGLPTLREYRELDDEHQHEVDALSGNQKISELAAAAQFLVERKEDPELDALDASLKQVDRVRRAASHALGENSESTEATASPPQAGPTNESAPKKPEAPEKKPSDPKVTS